jgi:hypothetical protein
MFINKRLVNGTYYYNISHTFRDKDRILRREVIYLGKKENALYRLEEVFDELKDQLNQDIEEQWKQ